MRAISDIFLTINGVHERLQFYSAIGIVRLYCRFAGDRMVEVVKKLYLRIEFILDKILCKFADYIRRVIVAKNDRHALYCNSWRNVRLYLKAKL